MKEPELVPLEAVPEAEIIELLRAALGAEQLRTAEFWRWKHHENPFGKSAGLVAIDETGRPVALRVFLRWELEAGGQVLRAVRAVDTATHPDRQRRGLFRRLTTALLERLADEGLDLVFNTPNPRSLRGYLTMGWQEVGRLPLVLKPRRPIRLAMGRLRRGPDAPCEPAGLLPCDEVFAGPDVAQLIDRHDGSEPRIHTRRSARYLRWRYVDMPAFRYGALTATEGPATAVGVFRLRRRAGALELSVSELLTERSIGGERLGAQLCRRALEATGADYAVAIADRRSASWQCFRQAGFLPFRFPGPTLVVRRLRSRPLAVDPGDLSCWQVTVGDMELF